MSYSSDLPSYRSIMSTDPLSDVLSLLKVRSSVSGGFDVAGPWSVGFGRYDGIKFHAVLAGECWVVVEGVAAPLRVRAGECFLQASGRPFRLASDPALEPVALEAVVPAGYDGRIATYNGGGDCTGVGVHVTLADGSADLLLDQLPPIIHIDDEGGRATMRWCLERMREELFDPQPGGALVAQQLATMALVQALRLHLSTGPRDAVGWLYALADKRLRAAIGAMHTAPGERWTVATLAERAAMSRTSFAVRFKEVVGLAPLDYLTRWRMMLAGQRLAAGRESVSEIGLALGYESEKSFSTAFRRVMRDSPRRYGRGRARESVTAP